MAQTLCERNSQIMYGANTTNILDFRRLSSEELQSQTKTLTYTETSKPAFLDVEEGLIEKTWSRWNDDGITGAIEVINKTPNIHPTILNLTLKLHKLLVYVDELKNSKSKRATPSNANRKNLFSCHPHTTRLAVVVDNKIKVLCLNRLDSDYEIILKDKRVQKIFCLAWRPKAAMSIAVGSVNGVLVWLLDPNLTNKRPGVSATRFLQSKNMPNEVNSVSWSPCGKLLACTCKNSISLWIWNILSQKNSAIQRVGSNLTFNKWSPCGQRLITATYSGMFRVWETKTFDCVKWADLNGNCTSACWSTCGTHLLFTVANEPFVYFAQFFPSNDNTIDIGGTGVALKCADVSAFASQLDEDEEPEKNWCQLIDMVWDSTNSRLAVLVEDGNEKRIALYHTRVKPQLQLVPCGYVNGEEGEEPLQIEFVNGFDKGALLAIYWSSGCMSLVPLYFNQNLTSPRLGYITNIQTLGYNEPPSSALHRTIDESLINHDLSVGNDYSIFSTVE